MVRTPEISFNDLLSRYLSRDVTSKVAPSEAFAGTSPLPETPSIKVSISNPARFQTELPSAQSGKRPSTGSRTSRPS